MTGPEQWTPDLPDRPVGQGDPEGPADHESPADGASPAGPAAPGDPPSAPRRPDRRRRWLVVSVAVIVVVAAGIAVGLVLGSGSDGSPSNRPAPTGSADAGTVVEPPGGTPPGGSAVPLSEPEQRLLGQLKPFTVSDCRSAPPAGTGIDAALSCVPGITADPAAPDRLLISHYRDTSALAADVTRRSAAITDVGSCSRGEPSSEQVVHNAHRVGTFLCDTAPGRFSIFWTVDSEQVAFSADSADAAKLMAWWRGFMPI